MTSVPPNALSRETNASTLSSDDGNEKCAAVLIEANADVNLAATNDGETPLLAAAFGGYKKCVAMLIEANADVNLATTANGETPLIIATSFGDKDCVAMLIEANTDVNLATC